MLRASQTDYRWRGLCEISTHLQPVKISEVSETACLLSGQDFVERDGRRSGIPSDEVKQYPMQSL